METFLFNIPVSDTDRLQSRWFADSTKQEEATNTQRDLQRLEELSSRELLKSSKDKH